MKKHGWSDAARSALIPENPAAPGKVKIYSAEQIAVIVDHPEWSKHVHENNPDYWEDPAIRSALRDAVARRSTAQPAEAPSDRPTAPKPLFLAPQIQPTQPPANSRTKDKQQKHEGTTPARKPGRTAEERTALLRAAETEARDRAEATRHEFAHPLPQQKPRTSPQPAHTPPMVTSSLAYPPIQPDPRIGGTPAATPKPAASTAPMTEDELSTEYRRLVAIAERRAATTTGKRRAASARPVRIPASREAVVLRSRGKCENPLCGGQPYDEGLDGQPLLDVDHIDDLALGGADLPENMVALCPNCHRVKTLGRSRDELREVLRRVAAQAHADTWAHGRT
ncbi:HNH endonuclease [Streptomyces sp. NPDC085481]|uniref:HNH endonuclease n=1 Tax=Streptomyces sp. NPDC085481 TaxID=3365727 RepID=UPI0037D7652E